MNLPYRVEYPAELYKVGSQVICLETCMPNSENPTYTRGRIYTISAISKYSNKTTYTLYTEIDNRGESFNGWVLNYFMPIELLNNPMAEVLYGNYLPKGQANGT